VLSGASWDAFVASNASGGGTLVFSRVTYELMASFWPTPFAAETMPPVAERMNNLPQVVFSRTLDKAPWNNTQLVKDDLTGEMRRRENEPGENDVQAMREDKTAQDGIPRLRALCTEATPGTFQVVATA
jgi:dihydrofolate reductase